jgi:hypothetical protein
MKILCNEDLNQVEEHIRKTIIDISDSLNIQLIKNSFACMY